MKNPPRLALLVATIPGNHTPGAFRYFSLARGGDPYVGGMIFRCPRCGEVRTIGFERPTAPEKPVAGWNGSRFEPTLSVPMDHAQCGWAGFLRRGVWEPT